jgi:Fe2+ transport system protein FeoA
MALITVNHDAQPSQHLVPLSKLGRNQQGMVVEMCSCPEVCERLGALGIAPGLSVKMLAQGRTCLVQAGRTRLSLRLDELNSILVDLTL